MLPLIDYSALSHTRSRDVLWTQLLRGLKKAQTGAHAVQIPLPLLETVSLIQAGKVHNAPLIYYRGF